MRYREAASSGIGIGLIGRKLRRASFPQIRPLELVKAIRAAHAIHPVNHLPRARRGHDQSFFDLSYQFHLVENRSDKIFGYILSSAFRISGGET